MNHDGKQDLEALLASWPAPLPQGEAANEQDEERTWEERAAAIVQSAVASKRRGRSGDEARDLLAAPALAPELGEGATFAVDVAAGEKKMSQEKEPGEAPASTVTPLSSERKRPSLKEIAARASQSGARLSSPGITPPPSSVASLSSRASTSTPLPRPVEAGKEDSGVINLDVVRASVTAQQVAAAENAKPASEGLFDDDNTAEPANEPAPKVRAVEKAGVVGVQPKKSNVGLIAGVAIAVLGVAAAVGIVSRKPPSQPSSTVAVEKVAPAATVTSAVTAVPVVVTSAEATATPTSEADSKPADTARVTAAPFNGGAVATPRDAPAGSVDPRVAAKASGAVVAPVAPGKSGDLQSEMARAVNKDGTPVAKPEQAGPVPEPASGGAKSQSIPDHPSPGAVSAALSPVMGGAKACVAGADDVSRANITFTSSGSVSSVAVSGWAASHGKSGCVQAALKAAKTGAFSSASYSVGIPIRP